MEITSKLMNTLCQEDIQFLYNVHNVIHQVIDQYNIYFKKGNTFNSYNTKEYLKFILGKSLHFVACKHSIQINSETTKIDCSRRLLPFAISFEKYEEDPNQNAIYHSYACGLKEIVDILLQNFFPINTFFIDYLIQNNDWEFFEYLMSLPFYYDFIISHEDKSNPYIFKALQHDAEDFIGYLLDNHFKTTIDCLLYCYHEGFEKYFYQILEKALFSSEEINQLYQVLLNEEQYQILYIVREFTNYDYNFKTLECVLRNPTELSKDFFQNEIIPNESWASALSQAFDVPSIFSQQMEDFFEDKYLDVVSYVPQFFLLNDSISSFKESVRKLGETNYKINEDDLKVVDFYLTSGSTRRQFRILNPGEYTKTAYTKNYPIGFHVVREDIGWEGKIDFECDDYIFHYRAPNGFTFSSTNGLLFPGSLESYVAMAWGLRTNTMNEMKKEYKDDPPPNDLLYILNNDIAPQRIDHCVNIPIFYNNSRDIPFNEMVVFINSFGDEIEIKNKRNKIVTLDGKDFIDFKFKELSDRLYVNAVLRRIGSNISMTRNRGFTTLNFDIEYLNFQNLSYASRKFARKAKETVANEIIKNEIIFRYMSESTVRRCQTAKQSIEESLKIMLSNGRVQFKYYKGSDQSLKNKLIVYKGHHVESFTWVTNDATQEKVAIIKGLAMDTTFRSMKPYSYIIPHFVIKGTSDPIGLSVGLGETKELYADFLFHLCVLCRLNIIGKSVITDGLHWFSAVAKSFGLIPLKCSFHKIRSLGCTKGEIYHDVKKIIYCPSQEKVESVLKPNLIQKLESDRETGKEVKNKILKLLNDKEKMAECCMYGRKDSGMPMTNNLSESPHRVMNLLTRNMRKTDRRLFVIVNEVLNLKSTFAERNERAYKRHVIKMMKRQDKYNFKVKDGAGDEIYYSNLFEREAPGIHSNMERFKHVLSSSRKSKKEKIKIMEEAKNYFGDEIYNENSEVFSRFLTFLRKTDHLK